MIMSAAELQIILDRHEGWLKDRTSGKRADLRDADLRDADLHGANLCYANLRHADLRGANLRGANLCYAYLHHADLCGAYLRGANLRDADLRDTDLRDAYLRGANLRDADLRDANLCYANLRDADLRDADLCDAYLRDANLCYANLRYANLRDADLRDAYLRGADLRHAINIPDMPWMNIVPDAGCFVGWKKVHDTSLGRDVIIQLQILADAKRSNAMGRKCRCSAAEVLAIQELDGTSAPVDAVTNYTYDPPVTYAAGKTVTPDSYDDNRWRECSHGIHFFITRQEAVEYIPWGRTHT